MPGPFSFHVRSISSNSPSKHPRHPWQGWHNYTVGPKMKIHRDPTTEFAHLVTTRWQKYVLYHLESAAGTSPWGPASIIGILAVPMFIGITTRSYGSWWPPLLLISVALLRIADIYFSRAVLTMMRGPSPIRNEEDQQDASSNGGQRLNLNSGFHLRRG